MLGSCCLPSNRRRQALYEAADRPTSALALHCCQFACCIPDRDAFCDDSRREFYPAESAGRRVVGVGGGEVAGGGAGEQEDAVVSSATYTSDWMEQLASMDSKILLRDLILPGSHDSASYSVPPWKPYSGVARCQNLSCREQLLSGARYLDLRIAGSRRDAGNDGGDGDGEETDAVLVRGDGDECDVATVWHGPLEGTTLGEILGDVRIFLDLYPGEFVVLEVVPEYGRPFSCRQRVAALRAVQSSLGDKAVTPSEMRDMLRGWTLADVTERKKQIVVMVHPRFYEGMETPSRRWTEEQISDEFGFVNSHKWMRNKWHNTRDVRQLLDWNLEDVQRCRADEEHVKRTRFHGSQVVLTPGLGGPGDIFRAMLGGNSLRPVTSAYKLYGNGVLDDFLRRNADEPWNILSLDFFDLCHVTVHFLLALNFPVEIDVRLAGVHEGSTGRWTDVTEAVRSNVFRRRVLFLTDVCRDLALPDGDEDDEATLMIAYSIGSGRKGDMHVATTRPDSKRAVMISHFASNCNRTVLKKAPGGGYVYDGETHDDPPGERVRVAAIKYEYDGQNNCGFELVTP